MIKLHPSENQLKAFALGTIDDAMALVVSAHCDMCEECASKVRQYEAEASEDVFDIATPSRSHHLSPELESMMKNIMAQPAPTSVSETAVESEIELDGRYFPLPRALRSLVGRSNGWSHMVGQLWQSSVNICDSKKGHFVFLGPNAKVPEHTHKGNEITLVIDGEFKDQYGLYKEGDFIVRSGEHIHSPQTVSENGCLIFTVVEEPLRFTSGIARLLNPFSHLFFR